MEDIDAPMGKPFVHVMALLAAALTGLPAGALDKDSATDGVRLLRSTMGTGYVGPAPIKGHGPHRYVFQLFALPAPAAPDAASAPRTALLAAVDGPALARARLTGTYER
jgi:hypothetical protein